MPLPRLCTYQNRTRCPSIFETVTAIFRHTVSNQRSLPLWMSFMRQWFCSFWRCSTNIISFTYSTDYVMNAERLCAVFLANDCIYLYATAVW